MEFDLQSVAKNLEKHGFKVLVLENKEVAIEWLKNDFAQVKTVGRGGSATLDSLGFNEIIESRGMELFYHGGAKPEDKRRIWRAAGIADAYFMSANAIIADGRIFNVDGAGNRVAAMSCGPEKVYYVAGKNKIVSDLAGAHTRLEKVAAPKNVARIGLPNGCAKTGECVDCNSSRRICNSYNLLARAPWAIDESWVLLINEDLGF